MSQLALNATSPVRLQVVANSMELIESQSFIFRAIRAVMMAKLDLLAKIHDGKTFFCVDFILVLAL